jgi:hypothetical protein
MSPVRRLRNYAVHPDPMAAACNRIALLVASNQPFYPLYLWWIVGGDWRVSCWTFLSTPFFAAVPAMARRNPPAGRAMLPLTGIANGILSTKAFGEASGVELFLIPCGLIACLAFRRSELWVAAVLLVAMIGAGLLHGHYGAPLGRFETSEYGHFLRLNATSVAVLSVVIVWSFSRARAASAPR